MRDDLGTDVEIPAPPRRVVSLVPSLTEAVAVSAPGLLVAATDWCTHPVGLDVARVRGTKNPDVAAIVALAPDLVVANQEENRELDVRRLREAGVPVWVTRIDTVDEALGSLDRLLVGALGLPEPGWLREAREVWAAPPGEWRRVAVPIWRDPWRWVGGVNYADDLLSRLGWENVVADERYPGLSPEGVAALGPDIVLLPDEPYAFTVDDGPDAFPALPCVPVSGRDLFWYGPAMVAARANLEAAVSRGPARPSGTP